MIDGEIEADTAVVPQIIGETYSFSTLKGGANVLIFPNLEAGNIAYKLLHRLGGAELIGHLLPASPSPCHVPERGSEVNDIVPVAAVAVVDAQESGRPYPSLPRVAPE
jgi:malate dehydrogenase (oxaloacetate-decarboxylating)(NADP+)